MDKLVQNQRNFFFTGASKSVLFRKQQLQKLKSILKENEKELYESIYKDFKKGEFDTFTTELGLLYHDIDFNIKMVKRWASPKAVKTNLANMPGKSFQIADPYGVSLIIGAWNYPYLLSLQPAIAAIAAGNTVVLKPSELAKNTSSSMAKIINKNFDKQYFYVQEGGIVETTELLKQKFDKIFFTGSSTVGKIVYQAAAKNLTPVTLELGGKSPVFVLPDTDINSAARRIVWGKFMNAGQTCIAPDYILVHNDVKDELLDKIKEYILKFYEDANQSSAFIRIINEKNFKRLNLLIDKEKIYFGGNSNADELYIEPTILHNVNFNDSVMQEEIFGPILPVISFSDIDSVIQQVAQDEKPLALYLFTKSDLVQQKVLSNISFGGGCINDTLMHLANPYLPFGGVGASGIGNYHDKAGFDTFTHYKSVLKKGFLFDPMFKYPPYNISKLKWVKRFL